jgi:hypothetical protein
MRKTLPILAAGALLLTPAFATGHTATVVPTCDTVTATFTSFADKPGNTAYYTITANASPVSTGTWGWDGSKGTKSATYQVPTTGEVTVKVAVRWDTNGHKGSASGTYTAVCNPVPAPTPPVPEVIPTPVVAPPVVPTVTPTPTVPTVKPKPKPRKPKPKRFTCADIPSKAGIGWFDGSRLGFKCPLPPRLRVRVPITPRVAG